MDQNKINDLKAQLAKCPGDHDCSSCLLACTCHIEQQALEYILELEKSNQDFVNVIHSLAECAPMWISVEDRLPQEDGSYIVCTAKGSVYCTKFSTRFGPSFHKTGCVTITHWMPLPEPPREA